MYIPWIYLPQAEATTGPAERHRSLKTCSNTNRTPLPATGVRQANEESLPTVRTHTADDGLPPERMTRKAVRLQVFTDAHSLSGHWENHHHKEETPCLV